MKEEHVYNLGDKPLHYNAKPIKYVITAAGCWQCTSHAIHTKDGYIFIRRVDLGTGTAKKALHRLVYEKEVGAIPEGGVVLHSCDNPACFNPDHLSTGTQAENVADMMAKGRQQRGERNHFAKLTEEDVKNIRKDTRGHRIIAECYGVTQSIISLVKNRKTWKHVE